MDIGSWLQEVARATSTSRSHHAKRKREYKPRSSCARPRSPHTTGSPVSLPGAALGLPAGISSGAWAAPPSPSPSSTSRRPTIQHKVMVLSDADETPRAKRQRRSTLPSAADTDSVATSQSTHSSARSSAARRLQQLEVAEDGAVDLVQLDLGNPDMPTTLRPVVAGLRRCARGLGVVSHSLQSTIAPLVLTNPNLGEIDDLAYATPGDDSPALTTVSIDSVLALYRDAAECLVNRHAEPSWNIMVHYPVMALALQPDDPKIGSIRPLPCTTARIIHDYHPAGIGKKLVDFCLYIDPDRTGLAAAITQRRRHYPEMSINSTNYAPLRHRPIVLSVESKNPGERLLDAQLQVGVWQAAQWEMLDRLTSAQQDPTHRDEGAHPGQARPLVHPDAMRSGGLPDFLPAIIIQGHDWHFVATTRRNGRTTLWVKQPIGSTETVLGIFQIVFALRYLASWAVDSYLPWFRRTVLGTTIDPDAATSL